MIKKKRIMVIGHEASLSGAPILLLNLFQLIIKREIGEVLFVIKKDGPLVQEYKRLAPVIVLKAGNYGEEKNKIFYFLHFFQNKIRLLRVLVKAFSYDYFFFNTVVNGKLMRWFRFYRKPIITYVHEMEATIDLYIQQGDAILPLNASNVIACPTELTKALLADKYKVQASLLRELNYYFPFVREQYNSEKVFELRESFRLRFGFNKTDFLIGSVGKVSTRKGIDLFIETCEKVVTIDSSIKFVWIGPFESKAQELAVKDQLTKRNLTSNLIFTGPLANDIYNFSPFDVFYLSSREDTYPLVVLEAALMKVPSICFADSGGIVEFIGSDAGWLVENFSAVGVANKIIELQGMRDAVFKRGNDAFEKVVSLHCNPDKIIDEYNSVITG